MYCLKLVALQMLLVIGFNFVEAADQKKFEKMRETLCNQEDAEIAEKLMGCTKVIDLKEYSDMLAPCGEGMENMEMEEMAKFWCTTPFDELEEIDECVTKTVREAGKEDEIQKKSSAIQVKFVVSIVPNCFVSL
ncbi:hypothetical protein TNCT_56011 [Trichonephila clavata]|uniref:Uncharacterized protein n=1 Tax=Trichonephila clavata TaxID=2740835 RepID=A0A8X6GM86_TRICU|nr:hypothetical protein TNCT_56011 [Trichonephila clavata]